MALSTEHLFEAATGWLYCQSVNDNAPLGSPTTGQRQVVGTAGSGAHSGHNKAVATYTGSAWSYSGPAVGQRAYSVATNTVYAYDGSAWTSVIVLGSSTVTASQISDASADGRSLITAANYAAMRSALGLGTLATQSGTFSGTSSGTNTGDQTNISGNAATVTTNANLTGPVTSVGNATTIADAELAAIAGLTSAADKLPRFTGSGTADLIGVKFGTYTPTLTGVGNVAASSASDFRYIQIGTTVMVSGTFDVDPTSTGLTQTGISLPVASDLGATSCSGTANNHSVPGQNGIIYADATNNRAEHYFVATSAANQSWRCVFMYDVI